MEDYKGLDVAADSEIISDETLSNTNVDLDDDGRSDYVYICNSTNCGTTAYDGTHLMFVLSSDGNLPVHLVNANGSEVDLSTNGDSAEFNFTHLEIGDYGFIEGVRTSAADPYQIHPLFDSPPEFKIYENPYNLEEDYDDDQKDDFIYVNDTHMVFRVSGVDNFTRTLGADICSDTTNIDKYWTFSNDEGEELASINLSARVDASCTIPANATFTVKPHKFHRGYFSAIYETTGTNHRPGNLARGDVLRLCYEAPGEITEDQRVRLNFIPKIGTPTLAEFVTPDVISTERVYLYP